MKSIRIFLIVTLIATITLVNVLSSVHGYSESMLQANKIFDNHLKGYANILNVIPWQSLEINQKLQATKLIEININDEEGALIAYKISNDENFELHSKNFNEYEIDKKMEPGYHSINFAGYRWRALYIKNDEGVKILVAERQDRRFIVSEKVVLESIFPIIMILPAIAILIWLIVGVGLAPVKKLAANFRQKQVTDLSPIELNDVPVELTLLASSANDLLLRLEQSFEREKRFASDAAHELRTPITALKLHIQNLIAESADSETINIETRNNETVELLKLSIDRMGHLVEQILTLNSTSADHYMASFITLDLEKTTQQIIGELYDSLEQKYITIELKSTSCEIIADKFGIETLLNNIISNAIKYTDVNGKIEVQINKDKENVCIVVMDSGIGIGIDQRERVFERFYRVDGDRNSSSVSGCGLGLSIVKRIADLHKASIQLSDSDYETGLKISICIPKMHRIMTDIKDNSLSEKN